MPFEAPAPQYVQVAQVEFYNVVCQSGNRGMPFRLLVPTKARIRQSNIKYKPVYAVLQPSFYEVSPESVKPGTMYRIIAGPGENDPNKYHVTIDYRSITGENITYDADVRGC